VRAIFLALVLIIFILDFPGVTYISYAFIILLLVSFMQVMRVAKKTLS